MVELDSKFPVLLFPIRIETKYHINNDGSGVLRVRFFPDQISVDTFDPRLTKQEITDAIDYWTTVKSFDTHPPPPPTNDQFDNNRDAAWDILVNKYGSKRAAYISKSVINYDPVASPDPSNPEFKQIDGIDTQKEGPPKGVCRILPRSFRVYGKTKADPYPILLGETKPILTEIDVGVFTFDPSIVVPDSMKWLTNFESAKDDGMAIEINLTADRYALGFEYIFVCGVRDDLTPQETKQIVENLFRAHRYSSGFEFLKQGTPTNLVSGQTEQNGSFTSLPSPSSSNSKAYRQQEFSKLFALESSSSSVIDKIPDGRIFEKKLGIDNVAAGVHNANNYEQINAAYMAVALWNVLAGQLLRKLQLPDAFIARLREHFIRYVRAEGSIPAFRIGKVPYGVLPITRLSSIDMTGNIVIEWEDPNIGGSNYLGTFFHHLKNKWLESVGDIPTVMNLNSGITPTKQLINILSMEAFSHSYYVRGLRDHSYVEKFISKVVGINPNLMTDLVLQKNKAKFDSILRSIFHITTESLHIDLSELYRRIPDSGFARLTVPNIIKDENGAAAVAEYLISMYKDLQTLGLESNYLKTTKDQEGIPGFLPQSSQDTLLFKLLRYSASILGEDLSQISDAERQKLLDELEEFKESLHYLPLGQNPLQLESVMLQTLDLCSYRLDAWLTSFANQRLDYLRKLGEATSKGLYVGCYGWIENLKPQGIATAESTKKPVYQGGYIQSPSYHHATAAAVLRDGYLTHSDGADNKDILKINLNSKRTKDAMEIIENIQNMPLSEILGYKFERRLHDAEADYLIDEFRKYFPLKKDDIKLDSTVALASQEDIAPRNLVDGFLLYKNWKRLLSSITTVDTQTIMNAMENDPDGNIETSGMWKPFYIEVKSKYASGLDGPQETQKLVKIVDQIRPHLDYLLEQVDGLSDLCVAESVYQAANGNYDRSAAVLEGLSGDGKIPTPEISSMPTSGASETQKVVLATEVESLNELNLRDINDNSSTTTTTSLTMNPNVIAEPNLNKILKSFYGDILFWIDLKDNKGNIILPSVEVTLPALGLEPIDLLYIKEVELKARLKYYGKTSNLLTNDNSVVYYCDVDNFDKKPSSESGDIDKKSFSELQFLVSSLQNMMGQSNPLKQSDFWSPQEDTSGEDNNPIKIETTKDVVMEIFQRFYDVLYLAARTIGQLEDASSPSASTETKRKALMNASLFNLSLDSIPILDDGTILESNILLDQRIGSVITELQSRLQELRLDDFKTKLSEWKAKLESGGGGLEALFDLIYSQLSSINGAIDNQTENKLKRYNKLLEMLLDAFKILLNIQSFLVIPPFRVTQDFTNNFDASSPSINKRALKWIRKASLC